MEKINIAKLLKDCPKGMELDCTMLDNVVFEKIDFSSSNHSIIIRRTESNKTIHLTRYGQYSDEEDYKCIIFPKGKNTWEGFQRPFKDGDIAVSKSGDWIGVVKSLFSGSDVYEVYVTFENWGAYTTIHKNAQLQLFRFATEKEKQKLFDAIKANGYKWNPETKTLEDLIVPKFKVGDRIKEKRSDMCGEIIDVQNNRYNVKIDDKGLYVYFREQNDWELLPHKFDITTLKPFDKILTRDNDKMCWSANIYSHYLGKDKLYQFRCMGTIAKQCIPYEGNEHLLGKTNDCDEYYKTWK